jgi:hypothetical protein
MCCVCVCLDFLLQQYLYINLNHALQLCTNEMDREEMRTDWWWNERMGKVYMSGKREGGVVWGVFGVCLYMFAVFLCIFRMCSFLPFRSLLFFSLLFPFQFSLKK